VVNEDFVMKPKMLIVTMLITVSGLISCSFALQKANTANWKHLSTVKGNLPAPNAGTQQTSSIVCDIDKDGINDFAVTERTKAPSVVWYRRGSKGWTKYVIDDQALHIEAGADTYDIDTDGDLDIVFGGNSQSNQVWWWENPYPNYKPNPVEPEPNRGRQKADALTKIPSAAKHLLCSHDRNLPPTLFRGREIAFSVTKELRCYRRADQICRQIKDNLSPALKPPYTSIIL
jgi:hypothetical protein